MSAERFSTRFPQEYYADMFQDFLRDGIGFAAHSTEKLPATKSDITTLLQVLRKFDSEDARSSYYAERLSHGPVPQSDAWYVPFLVFVCGEEPNDNEYATLLSQLDDISTHYFARMAEPTKQDIPSEPAQEDAPATNTQETPVTETSLAQDYKQEILEAPDPLAQLDELIMRNVTALLREDNTFQSIKNSPNVNEQQFKSTIKYTFKLINNFMKPIVKELIDEDPKRFRELQILDSDNLESLSRDGDLFAKEFSHLDLPVQEKAERLEKLYPDGFKVQNEDRRSSNRQTIPWKKMVHCEGRCILVCGQTLGTLHRRGGLTIQELYGILIGEKIDNARVREIGLEHIRNRINSIFKVNLQY